MTTASDPVVGTPEADAQQMLLGRFRELLSAGAEPGITLTNVYQELPITHPATICEIRGSHLELTTAHLQLAAISHCHEAFIRSPHLDLPVLGRLESLDPQRGVVRLSRFSFAELLVENRETVRVRFKRPTNIILHCGGNRISGVICDISLGGCSISTLVRQGLEEAAEIRVELKVIDKSTGLPNCARIPSQLVQVCGETPPFKCFLSFRHTTQSEQFLSVLINQRQLEILKELRETI